MLGFPGESDIIDVLNYCVLLAKHHIYINKITQNNSLDFYTYLIYLKQKLKMEKEICIKDNDNKAFDKFSIIFDGL